MFVEDCYNLGYIHKAHGITGDLIIRTDLQFSEETIQKWELIFLKIDGILVPFFIENTHVRSEKELLVRLEDIDDEIKIKPFLGLNVYIDKESCLEEKQGLLSSTWIDYKLLSKEEDDIGIISDFIEYPGQNMLEVRLLDGEIVLIPVQKDWVVSVDSESKIIIMDLPDGLVDINKS